MPDYNSTNRPPRRDYYDDRPARSPRPQGARPQGARPQGARPQGSRPQGARPQGSRPPQGRRPAPRRRRRSVQPRFIAIVAVLVVLIVALIIIIPKLGKGNDVAPSTVNASPVQVTQVQDDDPFASLGDDTQADTALPEGTSPIDALLEGGDANGAKIEIDQIDVSDLSITPGLPEEWINVLLLGTDARTMDEPCRTDTMIICSVNSRTGEVKLTSILRDTAVDMQGIGKYSGLQRINAAHLFGGPKYAMRIVNENFGMNIQYYASVNFFGFSRVAQALGGIEVNISEAEMHEINEKQKNQYFIEKKLGIVNKEDFHILESYGPQTHLDGNQTLAYARVRYVDNDVSRAERQRNVLIALKDKLKGKNMSELLAFATELYNSIETNLTLPRAVELGTAVVRADLSKVDTLRLPEANSFKEERRNDKAMIYDTDFQRNSVALYNFIYE